MAIDRVIGAVTVGIVLTGLAVAGGVGVGTTEIDEQGGVVPSDEVSRWSSDKQGQWTAVTGVATGVAALGLVLTTRNPGSIFSPALATFGTFGALFGASALIANGRLEHSHA